jgi:hypothetical protein
MLRLLGVAVALAVLASCGCGRPEEKFVGNNQTMAGTALPLLDREAPARLETATFAVG